MSSNEAETTVPARLKLILFQIINRYWNPDVDAAAARGYLHDAAEWVGPLNTSDALNGETAAAIDFLIAVGNEATPQREPESALRREARKLLARKVIARITEWRGANEFLEVVRGLLNFFGHPNHCDIGAPDLQYLRKFCALCFSEGIGTQTIEYSVLEPVIINTEAFDILDRQRVFWAIPALYSALRDLHGNPQEHPETLQWEGWREIPVVGKLSTIHFMRPTLVSPRIINDECAQVLRLCGDILIAYEGYAESSRPRQLATTLLGLTAKFLSVLRKRE